MPKDSVTYEDAVHMVRNWVAKWVNKCRGIQMLHGKALLKIRDRSCQMGPCLVELAAAGNRLAGVICEAWRFVPVGVFCEYPKAA
jgi:hypothetical protein